MDRGRKKVSVGATVKIISRHWLRACEEGVVIDHRPRAQKSWLVKFEHSYPGGGIEGDKLYLDETEFLEVERKSARNGVEAPTIGSRKFSAVSEALEIQ